MDQMRDRVPRCRDSGIELREFPLRGGDSGRQVPTLLSQLARHRRTDRPDPSADHCRGGKEHCPQAAHCCAVLIGPPTVWQRQEQYERGENCGRACHPVRRRNCHETNHGSASPYRPWDQVLDDHERYPEEDEPKDDAWKKAKGPRNGQQTREKGDQPHGDRRDGITGECPAQDRPKFKAGSIAFRLGSRFADADGLRL